MLHQRYTSSLNNINKGKRKGDLNGEVLCIGGEETRIEKNKRNRRS